jgi:hypothetical protein
VANPQTFQQDDGDGQPSGSVQLARRLLARDTATGASDAEIVAVGLRKTCARITSALRNAMGVDGCNALLVRAVTRTEAKHPLIADFRRSGEGNISFDGLAESVDQHGVVPVTAAIEALLAALLDTLVRLIGEEMTVRLTAADAAPESTTNGGASKS